MKHSFETSRRNLLRFLGGASAGAAVVGANKLPETVSGIVLAQPEDVGTYAAQTGGDWIPNAGPRWCWDVVPWTIYERLVFRAGERMPPDCPLLMNPIGSTMNRGIEWTNMRMYGQLPLPSIFRIDRIRWLVSPGGSPEDLNRLVEDYEYAFYVADKVIAAAPVTLHLSVGELGASVLTGDDFSGPWTSLYSEIGRSTSNRMGPCSDFTSIGGYVIAQQTSFYGRIAGNPFTPKAAMTLWFCLEGLMARGVQ